MVSEVQPQEETQERHMKIKFVILRGPRERKSLCHKGVGSTKQVRRGPKDL